MRFVTSLLWRPPTRDAYTSQPLPTTSSHKPAQSTFWGGYAGYFQDPDLHQWEVAWNPGWNVQE